ncbi:hypothetical protein Rsub_04650 [Raphidocelis subcapitata]|uniref:Prefoldin subunit n=1 Tax=Raphidocelis subcapitata TaxID=307507 RepID=A0A2V0NWC7_9CHLO|nr:hypothetical protein Rsub_04650 [Raphidocelis subcapitata]|eukprot:GBF91926.1 hypothetical protein Rsub_04650 [Raphidocelis subcapitata]
MAQPGPDKDTQTLLELRNKLEMSSSYLAMVQQQQRRNAVNTRRAQLTLDELQALPESAPMFKIVGKAYFFSPKPELVEGLSSDVQAGRDAAGELLKQHERAEKALRDVQTEITEVVKGSPAAAAAFQKALAGA